MEYLGYIALFAVVPAVSSLLFNDEANSEKERWQMAGMGAMLGASFMIILIVAAAFIDAK